MAIGCLRWTVPAIALETASREPDSTSAGVELLTVVALQCRQCARETAHRFTTRESVPDDAWTGHPIWECEVCSAARYGPAPEWQKEGSTI